MPLLSDDAAAMDVFVQETLGRQDFNHIIVIDDQGIVRAGNTATQVSAKYVPPPSTAMASKDAGVKVDSFLNKDGREVLDFGAPVLFQGKEIGRVQLGIFAAPLTAVANLMLVMLAILTLVTVAAVAAGTYFLAQRLSSPARVLRNSLQELANGRYDYRIADKRKDEFGELFAQFDRTAAALEQRHDPGKAATTIPPPAS